MAFAQIYIGCKCTSGETWRVNVTEIIEGDEIYETKWCELCDCEVWKEKEENGMKCVHALTTDEIRHEQMRDDFLNNINPTETNK